MNRKIKILQFTIASSLGGRTKYIFNIWRHIDKSRFQFDFVTFSEDIIFANELIKDGCEVYKIKNHPNIDMDEFIKEFRTILDNKYDVIEIHTSYWESTIVEQLAKECGIHKIIIHGHSSGISAGRTKNDRLSPEQLIEIHERVKASLTSDIATDFWACSKEVSSWLFEPEIPGEKIKIVHNTIDTTRFKFSPEQQSSIRKLLGINESDIVLGFTGRLEPVKNVEFIIKIFSDIYQIYKRYKIVIVGDGSLRKELEDLCENLKLTNAFIFVGRVENVEDYLQAMDIFLMPSFYEGFPISLLEAECAGVKCIVSNNITKEVNVLNDISYLPLDISEWVNEIIKYGGNIDRSRCACKLREKGFDTESEIKNIQDLYKQ